MTGEGECEACVHLPLDKDGYSAAERHIDDLHALIAALRSEVEQLRKQVDCGEETCAWVGGCCARHANQMLHSQLRESLAPTGGSP